MWNKGGNLEERMFPLLWLDPPCPPVLRVVPGMARKTFRDLCSASLMRKPSVFAFSHLFFMALEIIFITWFVGVMGPCRSKKVFFTGEENQVCHFPLQ